MKKSIAPVVISVIAAFFFFVALLFQFFMVRGTESFSVDGDDANAQRALALAEQSADRGKIITLILFVCLVISVICIIVFAIRRASTIYCTKCHASIPANTLTCPHCGMVLKSADVVHPGERKEWLVTLLLCFFLGGLGAHRFYSGHIGIGIVQLLTVGGCGIWALIDFIRILIGSYTDANGNKLVKQWGSV